MMAFPGMLAQAARDVGMKVPPAPDDEKSWTDEEYPHFSVFCKVQLARPIRWGEHWENAKVVAGISEDEIRKVTLAQLIEKGLEWHC